LQAYRQTIITKTNGNSVQWTAPAPVYSLPHAGDEY
jgi:hypothetical protein